MKNLLCTRVESKHDLFVQLHGFFWNIREFSQFSYVCSSFSSSKPKVPCGQFSGLRVDVFWIFLRGWKGWTHPVDRRPSERPVQRCVSRWVRDPSVLSVRSGPVQSTVVVPVLPDLPPLVFWKKALEKVLVFRGALRRPGPDQSSGAGGVRCGRPWDSRGSEPARFHPRCR